MAEPSRRQLEDRDDARTVRDFLRNRDMPLAAGMLDHYLGGSGAQRAIPLERLRENGAFVQAEERLLARASHSIVFQALRLLASGPGPHRITTIDDEGNHTRDGIAYEDVNTYGDGDLDLFGAIGNANIKGHPEIELLLEGSRFHLSGGMRLVFSDDYDFDSKEPILRGFEGRDVPSILAGWASGADPWFDLETLDGLRQAGLAKEFTIATEWRREVSAGLAFAELPETVTNELRRRINEHFRAVIRAGLRGGAEPPLPSFLYEPAFDVFRSVTWSP